MSDPRQQAAMALRNRPLMLERSALDALLAGGPHAQLERTAQRQTTGYLLVEGVAVIPVMGTLFKRGTGIDWLDEMLGVVSTEALTQTFRRAVADPSAQSILLQLDSPGGETRGMFDLADTIRAARGTKPIVAMADEWAFSAAYLIASAADRIVVPRTGGVGSIGVYAVRVDLTALNAAMGVKVDVIQYGDRKTDGNPDVATTDAELADLQAQVNRLGEMFTMAVAANRGLPANTIRNLQARTFDGPDGVTVGLADEVGTFPDTLMELATAPSGDGRTRRTTTMSQQADDAGGKVLDFAAEKARLEEKAREERLAGKAEGGAEARTRLATITNQCLAAKRPELIAKFAGDLEATVATVAAELAALAAAESDTFPIGGARMPGAGEPSEAQMLAELNPTAVYARRKADVRRAQGRAS